MEPLNPRLEDDLAAVRAALNRAVARVCPYWLADQADDLVQVALMRVMDVSRRAEGQIQFTSFYLRKAAYSAVVDEIRRRRRRQEVSLDEGDAAPMLPSAGSNPEQRQAGREIGRAIRACLERLVAPRRLAATLHLQGHTVPEVCRLMGWSEKRAENLVYRGLADLRQCLAGKGVTP